MSDDARREDRILDHEYDEIREYDNPLPRWWLSLFWITIVFSAFYFVYYQFGHGKDAVEAYNDDMVAYYDQQAKELTAMGTIDDAKLREIMHNPSMVAGGQQLFAQKCSPCHGMHGEGNIGPNLTDDYWLHGGTLADIYHTISDGVPAKGMLAWKSQLRPAELLSVAAYVGTLRGTHPAGAKAPQGDLQPYDPDVAAPAGAAGDAATETSEAPATTDVPAAGRG